MHLLQPQLISHVSKATCYTTARISGVYYVAGGFFNPPLGYERALGEKSYLFAFS